MIMTFQPLHCGVYFTADHIREAKLYANRPPFQAAWENLSKNRGANPQDSILRAALRYRLADEAGDIENTTSHLLDLVTRRPTNDVGKLDEIGDLLTLAQSFECLRDHPSYSKRDQTAWLEAFFERMNVLNTDQQVDGYVERLWMALLNLVTGIVLEHPRAFETGVEYFRAAIENDVRPQGFITNAVAGEDGGSMYRQVRAAAALVLMAEAAAHVGVDLWNYSVRGVSVVTTAIYPIYYFYTTEKWTWDEIAPEDVQAVFRQHGGYLEIVHKRTGHKDLRPVLDELRPIFDAQGGGATTLTHGVLPPRKGLFG
jgi:hypothetical protein